MRRGFRGLLSAALCAGLLTAVLPVSTFAAETVENPPAADQTWSDYENNQALVVHTDGSVEVVSYDSREALEQGVTALRARDDVSVVQPNYTYESDGTAEADPLYGEQWALSNDGSFRITWPRQGTNPAGAVRAAAGVDIDAEKAWDLYNGGERSAVVALIDTGVDTAHSDLQGALWTNSGEIPGNGVDDDGNGYVDDVNGWNFCSGSGTVSTGTSQDDHGTHCAGTIAARSDNGVGITGILGSTDRVHLMVLKALGGADGTGSTADIIRAIQYAQNNGASIVNLSLGTADFDYALYTAIKNSPMLFVVAAGNDGADSSRTPSYPADYDLPNIISVANLSCDGALEESSDYGAKSVDLAAPGTCILSTTADGGYGYMTGTSMAAPMVTAAAAMLYTDNTGLSLPQVKEILLDSAAPRSSLTGKVATGGMLDLGAALAWDTSGLTAGSAWAPEDGGSAPVLRDTVSDGALTLTVSDADEDVAKVCYAAGTLDAADFAGGAAGTQVRLTGGTARFRIVRGGTYTFYAIDQAGHQSVLTVTVTAQAQTGGGQASPARFWFGWQ